MKLAESQMGADSLASIGAEVLRLLSENEVGEVAKRFGYALALGRSPDQALVEDIGALGVGSLAGCARGVPKVSYFRQNDTGLVALVEGRLTTRSDVHVLVELVVTGPPNGRHISLEDVSVDV